MENHRLALTPGYQIDQFRIESVLGKGGFGITYVALDLQLGKRVAIKELLPDSIATRVDGSTIVPHSDSLKESWEWARERFLDEARVLAGFSHPAIVGVHRLIEANGTVYLVMDHLEGESYEARLRRIGTEPDQDSLMAVVGPILDGLQEVHAKGLIHRDIKPENVIINRRGQPILIDFGSARSAVGATMTMTSIVTHGYSPIEQYQTKGRMGPWTDIYAMAAVMCRAITGEKPPVAADRLMDDDFVWLSNRGLDGFDKGFLAAVDWALRVRPEDRPQQIADLEFHLRSGPRIEANSSDKDDWWIRSVMAVYAKDYAEALKWKRRGAEQGDAFEQVFLGAVYESGEGVTKDDAEAVEWYRKAAEQGNAAAQWRLGRMYASGRGVAKDDAEAVKWFRKSAEQGTASAQRWLGQMYANGRGVTKDDVEAVKWFRKSAEQGNARAQRSLGGMYESGSGVAEDYWEALKWYRKAAEQGDATAQKHIDEMNKTPRP